mmetsp:Transcript_41603/g.79482  ORF Transcript_41603/g.79482 Transcript_41603/m.79482 type:complete len:278 (+) Transcript_41603:116-949(+)
MIYINDQLVGFTERHTHPTSSSPMALFMCCVPKPSTPSLHLDTHALGIYLHETLLSAAIDGQYGLAHYFVPWDGCRVLRVYRAQQPARAILCLSCVGVLWLRAHLHVLSSVPVAVEVAAGVVAVLATEQALRAQHLVVQALRLGVCRVGQRAHTLVVVPARLPRHPKDLVVRLALAAAVAVSAHHPIQRHPQAVLAPAVVGGSRLRRAVAVGDVQEVHALPAAKYARRHVVLPALLVLVKLHVVAGSPIGHGQVAVIRASHLFRIESSFFGIFFSHF